MLYTHISRHSENEFVQVSDVRKLIISFSMNLLDLFTIYLNVTMYTYIGNINLFFIPDSQTISTSVNNVTLIFR